MAGLWRNNAETPEGKYPIVLRRDGSPLTARYIVMALKDPCVPAALRAYAQAARENGLDLAYAKDMLQLAEDAETEHDKVLDGKIEGQAPADPDAAPHRKDDPAVLAWARSIGCPGS